MPPLHAQILCEISFLKIFAIIPTYNRLETVGRAIESVLQQTSAPTQLIVIDDGSTDGTAAHLEANPDVLMMRQENRGVSAARNAGIRRALGEGADWIALLDSDDEWAPQKLARQIEISKTTPAPLIHTEEIWIRNGTRVNPAKKHAKANGEAYLDCLPLCCISPSSAMIHRSLFTEIGLFDESLPACEDYDLWLRICARHPVHLIDEPLTIKYGGHADQLSRTHWGMDRFRVQALRKMIDAGELSDEYQAASIAMHEKKLGILMAGARKRGNTERVAEFKAMKLEP